MRAPLIFATLALGTAAALPAQDERTPIYISPSQGSDVRRLPREVADEVIRFFNAPGTLRFSGVTRIPEARGIDGDVAVLGGPVSLGGRISGSLYVINGDLVLEPGAVIGGDVLVVGGTITGERNVAVAGEMRSYPDVLRYRRSGDDLVYAPQRESLVRWRQRRADDSRLSFVLALGGTYNRVEGVPIVFGPRLNLRLNDNTRFVGDARLIMRTGESFSLDDGRYGYRARGEILFGSRVTNLGLGARAWDQVSSVEPWPLRDFEAGWAAFLLHSDYRDWYRRRGYGAFATLRPSARVSFTVEARRDDVFSTDTNHVWTLFNNGDAWRANPAVSDGEYRSLHTSLRIDTRDGRDNPSTGLLINAEFEAAEGSNITGTIDPNLICVPPPGGGACVPASYADGTLSYTRAWLDARAYMRLTPSGRFAIRVAGGGKMGGDDLPMQHRVSLGYPDPLPGYTFRELSCGGQNIAGHPAACDRAVVAQAELRTHLGLDFGPDWANDWGDDTEDDRWQPFHVSGPDIVMFANAGYAWSLSPVGGLPADKFPSLKYWQPDLGIGLDLGPIGAYVAKSIGPGSSGATFTMRMGRRF